MRYIHQVIDDLQAEPEEDITPMHAALNELLGGERGSLPELADRFTQAGLGRIMASWIGDGENLPVSAAELRQVLGESRAEDLATLAGMSSGEFLLRLARVLPSAVHHMTPEGKIELSLPER